mgnify:CR=1 FL=1
MRKHALLPCNGLDKAAGPLARELALALAGAGGGELVCPVLSHRAPARYAKLATELPLLAIDGCATRCASRLAAELGWTVKRRLQISDEAKEAGVALSDALTLEPAALELCRRLAERLLAEGDPAPTGVREQALAEADFSAPVEYVSFTQDKFLFRVPKDGFFFNENDCWARVSGNRARIGISDYMQQNLSDMLFCTPAQVGAEVEQFGEAGTLESTKAVFEIISPVSGRVVASNADVVNNPEVINQDPYERGWIVEMELSDFASDRELLLDCQQYLSLAKKKAAEFRP